MIVGGVAAGASTAARLRRLDESAEIIMFERGEYVSFANCGLPYYVGNVIEKRQALLVQTPTSLNARFDIDVRIFSEVTRILRDEKKVLVHNIRSGETYEESYDYLVLCPGAEPNIPPIKGVDSPNVFSVRNIPDSDAIKTYVETVRPQRAVVIGGGYIGLEMADMLVSRGLEVSLVEAADQVMSRLDRDMAAMVHNELRRLGIRLYLSSRVTALEGQDLVKEVRLENGQIIPADLVVMGIGVRPSSELAKEAGLAIGKRGGITVDEYLRTSDPYIFAAGDAIEPNDIITGEPTLLPMASPANRQGWVVANNIAGRQIKYPGVLGTGILKLGNLTIAMTGKNKRDLEAMGTDCRFVHVHPFSHATYYPGATQMAIKLWFDAASGRVLGAQIVGADGVDKRIDVLATAIRCGLTVFDLQELELAYAPPFSSAKDPVNMAGYAAGNIMNGDVEDVHWFDVADLMKDGAFLLDVRTRMEVKEGMAQGAVNIPVDDLRARIDELPADRLILVYCGVGLRSYIACRILMQNGFKVKNISGGFRLYAALKQDGCLTI